MARIEPKTKKQPMTQAEILAWLERMKTDPEMLRIVREGREAEARGEGVRWEALKRRHGGR